MTCDDLQLNLSFYSEDELTAEERLAVEEHISSCPLCRVELAEYRSLSLELGSLRKPRISDSLTVSIQNTLRRELALSAKPEPSFVEKIQQWLTPRLIPYGVGTFASLALFSLLAVGMMLPVNNLRSSEDIAQENAARRSRMALLDNATFDYAQARSDVARESPSLNPNGALIAVTSAMARKDSRGREIVLVADVFSDGIARINEVVQPSLDAKTMKDLENAMEQVPETSPAFVPAELDKRSDVVQIVLKIQRVNVTSQEKRSPKKARP